MCGCTGVLSPARWLRWRRRSQMDWPTGACRAGPRTAPRPAGRVTANGVARCASQACSACSAAAPTGTLRRLLPLPRTCTRRPAGRSSRAPGARCRGQGPRPGPPARPRAGRSRTAARPWRHRAPPARGRRRLRHVRPDAPHRPRPVPWARAWGPWAHARPARGCGGQPLARRPQVKAAPAREDERYAAPAAPAACICATARRMCAVCNCSSGKPTCSPPAAGAPGPACRG
jgi:hypothetical protein